MIVYTHAFEIEVGSQAINGEIEFNIDGIMSFKTDSPLEGLTLQQIRTVNNLLECFKNLHDSFEGITKIKVEEK
jgi:hypothetical protein